LEWYQKIDHASEVYFALFDPHLTQALSTPKTNFSVLIDNIQAGTNKKKKICHVNLR